MTGNFTLVLIDISSFIRTKILLTILLFIDRVQNVSLVQQYCHLSTTTPHKGALIVEYDIGILGNTALLNLQLLEYSIWKHIHIIILVWFHSLLVLYCFTPTQSIKVIIIMKDIAFHTNHGSEHLIQDQ